MQQLSLGRHVTKVLPSHAMLDPRQLGPFPARGTLGGEAAPHQHCSRVRRRRARRSALLRHAVYSGLGLDTVLAELRLAAPAAESRHRPWAMWGDPTYGIRDVSVVGVARGLLTGEFRQPEPAGDLTTVPGRTEG